MSLVDFVKKQLIEILEWTEDGDATLVWRFPTADREIQQGAAHATPGALARDRLTGAPYTRL